MDGQEMKLRERMARITPVDRGVELSARAHLDDLTKPRGSLGRLEDLAVDLYCIGRGKTPLVVDPVRQFTVAGDHGVVAEGVTSNPPEVTRQMVLNFLAGGAGVNVLCRSSGVELRVVDAGCAGGPFSGHPELIDRRVGSGTANIAHGPAMSREQCAQAILAGMELAADAANDGVRCLAIGEMGIGNTTSATALFAAYLDLPVRDVTGPGAGLGKGGIEHKIGIIEKALVVNADAIRSNDALAVLAALGGFEIAMMAGILLGASRAGLPCLVDGFIAQAAFVAAWKMSPACGEYAIFAHVSAEPGSTHLLRALDRRPLLDLGLRLGEGTGCALAVPILRAACAVFNDMATFSGAGVTRS